MFLTGASLQIIGTYSAGMTKDYFMFIFVYAILAGFGAGFAVRYIALSYLLFSTWPQWFQVGFTIQIEKD